MNQIDLPNKRAIVTGGARGIGFGVAQRLQRSEAKVCLWDSDADALATAIQALSSGGEVRTARVDLADAEQVQVAADVLAQEWGGGRYSGQQCRYHGRHAPTWEIALADSHRVMDVNLNGVFYCCRSVVPYLVKSEAGRMVNIASIAAKEGNPNAAHYSASKAAVVALTKSLGKELGKTNVRVNAVTPAVIRTRILEQMTAEHIDYMVSRISIGRLGQASEVAALVAWVCSADCSFLTGAFFDASGGRATY